MTAKRAPYHAGKLPQPPAAPETGLEARYRVEKINEPNGKHDECRYFVLDPAHDLIARQALAFYRNHAARFGYGALADDLTAWLDALDPAETPFPAAPETDVSAQEGLLAKALRDTIWQAFDSSERLERCTRQDASALAFAVESTLSHTLLADLEAARERVRVAEGERDALRRERDQHSRRADMANDRGERWRVRRDEQYTRAESAEAALAELRAGVEALAEGDLWEHADTLRALLGGAL
jgi:hypothetical protein